MGQAALGRQRHRAKTHWLINAAVSIDSDPIMFMRGAGLFFNGIVGIEDIEILVTQIIDMGASDQVVLNLISGGVRGMQIPFHSAAGVCNFDYSFVSAMALNAILSPLPLVDLMDIDIQGAENVVIHPAMEMLNTRVKRLRIGTHDPDIHSGLWELFFANEWIYEFDYAPATTHQTPWGAFETQDGILHFCNPRLCNIDIGLSQGRVIDSQLSEPTVQNLGVRTCVSACSRHRNGARTKILKPSWRTCASRSAPRGKTVFRLCYWASMS